MTYADTYNIRTTSVKFNDVADALDGLTTRQYGATTTGSSSAYIANPTPPWQSYDAASFIVIIPHVTNAAGATIQISPATNGIAAKDLRIAGSAISAGVMQAGIPTILAYTGVYFEVLLQNVAIPAGQINPFAGSTSPVGWLLCDGNTYNTYTYRTLHAVISNVYGGTAYNPGTTDQPAAVTTFQVPDLRRRMAVGRGTSDTLGFTEGGNNTGTAYASRSMSHSHTVPDHSHAIGNHTHTVDSHSHPLSNAGGAKISLTSTTLFAGRDGPATSWTATNADTTQAWGGSSSSRSDSIGLIGNTDAASPGTGNPNSGATTGGVTAFSTLTTTPPYLFVNYIIKF